MGKEKLALIVTLLLLGWVAHCNLSQDESPRVKTSEQGIEIPSVSLPDLSRTSLGLTSKGAPSGKNRDIFAAPRDTNPLPPLAIELPPPPHLPIIAPPLRPSVHLARWSDFYRASAEIHAFDFGGAEAKTEESAKEEAPATPSAPAKTAAADSPKEIQAKQEAFKKLYDWLRPNPYATLFGRIQNPNRYDLGFPKLRETESLLFQEVDPNTGKASGKPTPWPSERIQEYGFADTLANAIEIRKRRISYAAGNIREIIAFADWCVEIGGDEPKGFLEAERLYKKASELDAGDPSGLLGLGRFYERSFQLEEAYQLYQGMVEGKFSHRSEPFLHLGKLQARLRLFDFAEASLRRAVEIESSSAFCRAALAQFLLERERPKEAVDAVREIRAEPSGAEERAKIRTITGEALLAAGNLDEASASFKQALQSKADYLPARLGQAACHYARGSFSEGLEFVDSAIGEGNISTELYTARGLFEIRMGNYAAAERDLKSALGLNPLMDVYPLSALSFLYEITGHAAEAYQSVEAASTIDPTDPYVRYQKSRLLGAREDLSGAKDEIRAVLNGEFRFTDGLAFRGNLSYLAGEHDDAERYFAFACGLDPKNADLHAMRGLNLLKGGQIRRAWEVFQQTLSLNADQPTALNGIAYCAYADGRTDDAIRYFAEVEDRHKEEDEYRNYAKLRNAEIQDHRWKVRWTDNFERTDLRREWKDEARVGPLAKLENGSVRLEGQAREKGRTRLYRELAGRAFLSFSATLTADEGNQSIVGVQLVSEKKVGDVNRVDFEIDIVRTRSGKVATRFQTGQVEPEWKEQPGLSWLPGQPVKLTVERVGAPDDPRVRVRFNGEVVGEAEKLAKLKSIASDVRIGVFAETDAGRQAAVKMDDVEVIYREK